MLGRRHTKLFVRRYIRQWRQLLLAAPPHLLRPLAHFLFLFLILLLVLVFFVLSPIFFLMLLTQRDDDRQWRQLLLSRQGRQLLCFL